MPGNRYTNKQERKADHIADSYRKTGVSKKEAESRAWATVNKQDGGGKAPGGSGRKGSSKKTTAARRLSAKKTGRTRE